MHFTYNNHLKYTIGDRLYGHRETPYERFSVKMGPIDIDHYKKSSWINEQRRSADIVSGQFGNDFLVFYSGGADSEIVLRTFHRSGIKFTPIFIRFLNGYNSEDYIIADSVTKSMGIKLNVVDFDLMNFYNSGAAAELAASIQCRQLAYLVLYKTILDFQMPSVIGGELVLKKIISPDKSRWAVSYRENEDGAAVRFSIKYNLPLVYEWFSYTPEMVGYYLEHFGTQRLISNKNYKLTSISSKNRILASFMPEIGNKNKSHGYEKLLGFNQVAYRELYKTHERRLASSLDGIFIDDLMIQLFGDNYVSDKA